MRKSIVWSLVSVVIVIVLLPCDAMSGSATKNNTIKNTSAKRGDNPSAEMGLRIVYVLTDGGVSYDLKLTLNEFVTVLKKMMIMTTAPTWEKANDNFWVLSTSVRDPMSDALQRIKYGFNPIADNPKYILLTAINMTGQVAMPNEIVVFGLIVARKHNPNYSEH